MRRRNIDGSSNVMSSPPLTPSAALKAVDMFPKVHSDYLVSSKSSKKMSIVAICACLILCGNECRLFYAKRRTRRETFVVDTTLLQKLEIRLNVTFPNLSCSDVHLCAMDVAGDQQFDMEDTFRKRKVVDGKILGNGEVEVLNQGDEVSERIKALFFLFLFCFCFFLSVGRSGHVRLAFVTCSLRTRTSTFFLRILTSSRC